MTFIPPFACGDLFTSLLIGVLAMLFYAGIDWFIERGK